MVAVGIQGHQNPSRVVDLQRKGKLDSLLEGRGQLGRERLLGDRTGLARHKGSLSLQGFIKILLTTE